MKYKILVYILVCFLISLVSPYTIHSQIINLNAIVDSTEIIDDGIGNGDLAPNSVTTTEIRTSTIDSSDVKDGSLSVREVAQGRNGFALKTTVRDSANAAITANTTHLLKTDFNDSSNVRTSTTQQLSWTGVFADSIATNDSLTIEIKKQTPLGTAAALYIKNIAGVTEKVKLVLDFQTPSETARLDSIRLVTWTETTDATNFAVATVWDDSIQTDWKSVATATGDTLRSAVARTARYQGVTGINIIGGRIRLETTIQTIADSMFIAEPKAYFTLY